MPPEVRYAASGDVQVAYQVTGSGEVDLVLAPGTASHLDLDWDWPPRVRLIEGLGRFTRLIRFDKRGTGLSDRPTDAATLEERIDDIRAVMDAASSDRAAVLGVSEGGSMACVFAATYPERTHSLLVWGAQARWVQTDDYPWGLTPEESARLIEEVGADWPSLSYVTGPGAGLGDNPDPALLDWFLRYARAGASPAAIVALERMNAEIDTRDILPSIRVPTLVMNRSGDPVSNIEAARDLATRIPRARLAEYPGTTHSIMGPDADHILADIEEFITGSRSSADSERVLATILFVDIVDSTGHVARLGDAAWRDRLDAFYDASDRILATYTGVEVDRAGDGLLAVFDGPTRAIRAALAFLEESTTFGLKARAGLHTGEVERTSDGIRGIAVHTAARIGATAGPGEVLVSSTVRDLVAGSGLSLEDRGMHQLKGVPEPRALYLVTP